MSMRARRRRYARKPISPLGPEWRWDRRRLVWLARFKPLAAQTMLHDLLTYGTAVPKAGGMCRSKTS